MIKPQAGMPVLYHPMSGESFYCGQPLAAFITYVWGDACANLVVFDMYGHQHQVSSVTLWQPHMGTAMRPALGRWCEFPQWLVGALTPPVVYSLEPIGPGHRVPPFGGPGNGSPFVTFASAGAVPAGTPDPIQGNG